MTETTERDIHALLASGAAKPPTLELREQEKLDYAENGNPITVIEVATGFDTEERLYFQIRAESDGQPISFRLYANGVRDPFLEQLALLCTDGAVSGLRLQADKSGKGKPRVDLVPA